MNKKRARRRSEQSKTDVKQARARVDAESSAKEATKVTNKAKEATIPRKLKLAALVAPAVVSGVAGQIPQAVINVVQQAIHDATGTTHQRLSEFDVSGGEYHFDGEWSGYAQGLGPTAAERLATEVVTTVMRRVGASIDDPMAKRRYIQWVLSGGMTPGQAVQFLAADASPLGRQVQKLEELIRPGESKGYSGSMKAYSGIYEATISKDWSAEPSDAAISKGWSAEPSDLPYYPYTAEESAEPSDAVPYYPYTCDDLPGWLTDDSSSHLPSLDADLSKQRVVELINILSQQQDVISQLESNDKERLAEILHQLDQRPENKAGGS